MDSVVIIIVVTIIRSQTWSASVYYRAEKGDNLAFHLSRSVGIGTPAAATFAGSDLSEPSVRNWLAPAAGSVRGVGCFVAVGSGSFGSVRTGGS